MADDWLQRWKDHTYLIVITLLAFGGGGFACGRLWSEGVEKELSASVNRLKEDAARAEGFEKRARDESLDLGQKLAKVSIERNSIIAQLDDLRKKQTSLLDQLAMLGSKADKLEKDNKQYQSENQSLKSELGKSRPRNPQPQVAQAPPDIDATSAKVVGYLYKNGTTDFTTLRKEYDFAVGDLSLIVQGLMQQDVIKPNGYNSYFLTSRGLNWYRETRGGISN